MKKLILDHNLEVFIGPSNKTWKSPNYYWFYIKNGVWYVQENTMWDGATLAYDGPKDKQNPNYPLLWLATLIHDLGYMALNDRIEFPYSRKDIDKIFRELMIKVDFKYSNLYYKAVRWFGGIFNLMGEYIRKKFNMKRKLPRHLKPLEEFLFDDVEFVKIPSSFLDISN